MKDASLETRYRERLRDFPSPGCGRHKALLGASNLGIMSGVSLERIHSDLQTVTAFSPMPGREIQAAILKAAADHPTGGSYRPPPKPAPLIRNGNSALRRIIDQGRISDEAGLWEASPYRLTEKVETDPVTFLTILFKPDEWVYIGGGKETIGRLKRAQGDAA
jgi:hypothetical protein